MADVVGEWKRAVHAPEIAKRDARIAALSARIAELEAPRQRWSAALQRAADDIRDAAQRAGNAYDLSWNEVLIAMAMASTNFVPGAKD